MRVAYVTRVSLIIKSVRARLFKLKDSQLLKKLLVLQLTLVCYLTTWSASRANEMRPHQQQCNVMIWDLILYSGEQAVSSYELHTSVKGGNTSLTTYVFMH